MPLLNLVEHACSVGMLGTVGGGGAECGLIKDMRYMPDYGHLDVHNFFMVSMGKHHVLIISLERVACIS